MSWLPLCELHFAGSQILLSEHFRSRPDKPNVPDPPPDRKSRNVQPACLWFRMARGKGNDHAYRGDSLPASDTPRSAGGQARACPICARGDDRTRSAQILSCADTSHNGLSTGRVGSSAKASRPWLSGDMATASNYVERCSPFCWTTARVILLFPAQKFNTCLPNDLRSRSA